MSGSLILDQVVHGDSLPILVSGTFLYPFVIDHAVFMVKVNATDADPGVLKIVVTATLSAGGQVVLTGAGNGVYEVSITLTPVQTAALVAAVYVWELVAVDAAGDVRHLVVLGTLETVTPATQASS